MNIEPALCMFMLRMAFLVGLPHTAVVGRNAYAEAEPLCGDPVRRSERLFSELL